MPSRTARSTRPERTLCPAAPTPHMRRRGISRELYAMTSRRPARCPAAALFLSRLSRCVCSPISRCVFLAVVHNVVVLHTINSSKGDLLTIR